MDSKVEKKIEKEMGKKVANEIRREVDKEVERKVAVEVKGVEDAVRKEVEKKLHIKLYRGAVDSALKFKEEFRKQVVVAVSAALGFLIALSWRTPLQNAVNLLIVKMGLKGGAVYFEFLSALVITLIAVLGLMWVSMWSVKDG